MASKSSSSKQDASGSAGEGDVELNLFVEEMIEQMVRRCWLLGYYYFRFFLLRPVLILHHTYSSRSFAISIRNTASRRWVAPLWDAWTPWARKWKRWNRALRTSWSRPGLKKVAAASIPNNPHHPCHNSNHHHTNQ